MFNLVSSLMSGYSRFPVHEPDDPEAFIGLLLIKKVSVSLWPRGSSFGSQISSNTPSSCSDMTPSSHVLCPAFRYQFSPRPTPALTASRHSITCAVYYLYPLSCLADNTVYSQTGRAHLILITRTPGETGGALGVITLEGTKSLRSTQCFWDSILLSDLFRHHRGTTARDSWPQLLIFAIVGNLI
jgi:metal transporter CNNM